MERSDDAAEDPNRLPRCNAGDVHDTGSAPSYMEAEASPSDVTARQEQLVDDPEAEDEMQPPPQIDVVEEEEDDLPPDLCDQSSDEGDHYGPVRCDSSESESSDDSSDDDLDFEWTQRFIEYREQQQHSSRTEAGAEAAE